MSQCYKIDDYKLKTLKVEFKLKMFSLIVFYCNSQKLIFLQNCFFPSNYQFFTIVLEI